MGKNVGGKGWDRYDAAARQADSATSGKWKHARDYAMKVAWGTKSRPWRIDYGNKALSFVNRWDAAEAAAKKAQEERKARVDLARGTAESNIIAAKQQRIAELKQKQSQQIMSQKQALQLQKEWEKKEAERAYYEQRQQAFSDVTKPKRAFKPRGRSPRAMSSRVQQTRQTQRAPRQLGQRPRRQRLASRPTGVVRQPTIPRNDVAISKRGRSTPFTRPNVSSFSVKAMRRKGGSSRAF
tara:strand:- start:499 stop:1215 length:717 start_codon:yes stop_codon:yes gene_type:complete